MLARTALVGAIWATWATACTLVGPYPVPLPERGGELCVNGVDDDLDGARDCEEAECDGYCAVLPALPADGPEIRCPNEFWTAAEDPLVDGPITTAPGETWAARWCTRGADRCSEVPAASGESAEYVDDDATLGGDGTRERPHRTIGAALLEAAGAGLILVQPGNYRERVELNYDVEIRAVCPTSPGGVHWTSPDESGEPLIRTIDGTLAFSLVDLDLEPSAGAAIVMDGATLEGGPLRLRGAAPLLTAGAGSIIDVRRLDVDATGSEPAILLEPGAFARVVDSSLRSEHVASVKNATLRLEDGELRGAIDVRGAASTFRAERVFAESCAVSLSDAEGDVRESALRDGSSIDVLGAGRLVLSRVAFASGSRVFVDEDAMLDASRVAWVDATGCALRTRAFAGTVRVNVADATFVRVGTLGDEGPGVERDAAICVEIGTAALERVWIEDATDDAIRAGTDELRPSGVVAEDLTIRGTRGVAVRGSPTAFLRLSRVHVARAGDCALSWGHDAGLGGTDFFLEANRRGLCGPGASSHVAAAVLLDNQADLEIGGVESCATERSRGCGTPFVP